MRDGFRRALALEYFTVSYNMLEAMVSIFFGYLAGSPALVGFGLDSVVETLSGWVLIWRLRKHGRIGPEEEERIERRAQVFVGVTFLILGGYVLYESATKLYLGERPETSIPGIAVFLMMRKKESNEETEESIPEKGQEIPTEIVPTVPPMDPSLSEFTEAPPVEEEPADPFMRDGSHGIGDLIEE